MKKIDVRIIKIVRLFVSSVVGGLFLTLLSGLWQMRETKFTLAEGYEAATASYGFPVQWLYRSTFTVPGASEASETVDAAIMLSGLAFWSTAVLLLSIIAVQWTAYRAHLRN